MEIEQLKNRFDNLITRWYELINGESPSDLSYHVAITSGVQYTNSHPDDKIIWYFNQHGYLIDDIHKCFDSEEALYTWACSMLETNIERYINQLYLTNTTDNSW